MTRIGTTFASLILLTISLLFAQQPFSKELVMGEPLDLPALADGARSPDGTISLLFKRYSDPVGSNSVIVSTMNEQDGVFWTKEIVAADTTMHLDPTRISRHTDGSCLIFGALHSASQPIRFFLMELDAQGQHLYTKVLAPSDVATDDIHYGYSSMHTFSDGALLLSLGLGQKPVVMRLNADATVSWARSFITTESPTNKNPSFDMAKMADGGAVLTQKAEGDPYVVRVDAAGNVLWAHRFSNEYYSHTKVAVELANGDVAIAGFHGDKPFAARLDPDGVIQWFRTFTFQAGFTVEYTDGFKRIIERANGDLLVGSDVNSVTLVPRTGAVLLNSDGAVLDAWASASELQDGLGIVSAVGEQVLFAGTVRRVDEGELVITLGLVQMDPLFSDVCAVVPCIAIGTEVTMIPEISNGCNAQNEVVNVIGIEVEVIDLSYNMIDGCDVVTAIPAHPGRNAFEITPTLIPTGSSVQVLAPFVINNYTVTVSDGSGRVIWRSTSKNADRVNIPMDRPAGIYHISVSDGSRAQHQKVVVW